MDFWQRARSFAEEAATKTQELTIGSSKFSDLVSGAAKKSIEIATEASKKSIEIATEASKKSIEIAAEASKKSREIAAEASEIIVKGADQIKAQIPANGTTISSIAGAEERGTDERDLERFGVTDELRNFVKGITANTFRDFHLQDDSEVSDKPIISNVRQDLTAWQEKHAKIVLSTVKEISKLRYELCPRAMKERKFWRIYFVLVDSHVSPYEKRYTEEAMLKSAEKQKVDTKEHSSGALFKSEPALVSQKSKTSSVNEQDLDVFLLGELGDSDEGPGKLATHTGCREAELVEHCDTDGDQVFDDDFDKL